MTKKTVLIIGAGVIGSYLADEFSRRGAAVTVIDSAEAGGTTSAASFAWVNSNDKSPSEYSQLNVLGIEAHERSLARGGGRWFHQIGNVKIAQSDDEMAALESVAARLTATGYAAQLITASKVRELEPALQSSRLVGGVFYPREGWIDTATMCLSLLGRALASGARFFPYETVVGVEGNTVTTVSRDGWKREHSADVVVLAAGNGNRKILATSGVDFPTHEPMRTGAEGAGTQHTGVGIISCTGPVDSGIRHIVRATGIAMRPARNGGILFADHPTGGKWDLDDPRIWTVPEVLLDRARELYPPLKHVTTETVNLGIRVLPKDGLTIADWLDGSQSIYAVATHSGVTLSAHLAEAVADEVLTGARHTSLTTFGLARFAANPA